MTRQLGDTAPDFEAETTRGPIRFHEWLGCPRTASAVGWRTA